MLNDGVLNHYLYADWSFERAEERRLEIIRRGRLTWSREADQEIHALVGAMEFALTCLQRGLDALSGRRC